MSMLPARAPPVDGESLLSVIRRTANAMAYDSPNRLLKLVREAGVVPFWLNELRRDDVCERFAELLGLSSDELKQLTIHRYANSLVLTDGQATTSTTCDNKTRLRYFGPQSRICPQCIAENPIEKLLWSFRPIPVCLEHGLLLTAMCDECGKQISNARLHNERCRCGRRLDQLRSERVPDAVVQPLRRIAEALEMGSQLVPDASVPAGFFWLERLTQAINRYPEWKAHKRDAWKLSNDACTKEGISWVAAAEIVSNWPDGLFEFLDVYIHESKYGHTSTGLSRRLGRLHRHAAELEQAGHTGPANAMREYLTRRYSAGHINRKVCLFNGNVSQESDTRNWTTKTDAAAELKVSVATVSRLITERVLTGELHDAGHNGKSVGIVSTSSVECLKQQLDSSISLAETAARMGIDRHRASEMIRVGIFVDAVRIRRRWHIPTQDVDDVLRLVADLRTRRRLNQSDLSLRDATRRFGKSGFTIAAAVILIRDGQLSAERLADDNSLNSLVFTTADIEACLPEIQRIRDDRHGVPLNRLAKTLFPDRPTKERVLKKWIESGLLKAQRSGHSWSVSRSEVDRFRATYCLASEAARIIGRHRRTLATWEAGGHLTAAYGPRVTPGAGFTLYRRADVERLKANWPVRKRNAIRSSATSTTDTTQEQGDPCPTS
ncbi:MAG: TniQ family protein [Planctomycetota bacterium]|jgi:plasmid maintenance system antidote protein VapI